MNRHGGTELSKNTHREILDVYFFRLVSNNIFMKIKEKIAGFTIGVINSLLGSGGGMITVPYLKNKGLTQAQAQANSIAVILPLCALSTVFYLQQGAYRINDALIYLPAGIIGAIIGGLTLNKIPSKFLKTVFCAFMIYAGVRMIIK